MTQVHIDIRKPDASGTNVPLRVGMVWAPSKARVVDDALVVPEGFSIILDGADATITVAPTQLPDWVWRVHWDANSVREDHYYVVPDSVSTVEFTDLVEVDPDTLDPAASPEAAWWIALQSLHAVHWLSLDPGDQEPLRMWKPSAAEPQGSDGAEDADVWLKRSS